MKLLWAEQAFIKKYLENIHSRRNSRIETMNNIRNQFAAYTRKVEDSKSDMILFALEDLPMSIINTVVLFELGSRAPVILYVSIMFSIFFMGSKSRSFYEYHRYTEKLQKAKKKGKGFGMSFHQKRLGNKSAHQIDFEMLQRELGESIPVKGEDGQEVETRDAETRKFAYRSSIFYKGALRPRHVKKHRKQGRSLLNVDIDDDQDQKQPKEPATTKFLRHHRRKSSGLVYTANIRGQKELVSSTTDFRRPESTQDVTNAAFGVAQNGRSSNGGDLDRLKKNMNGDSTQVTNVNAVAATTHTQTNTTGSSVSSKDLPQLVAPHHNTNAQYQNQADNADNASSADVIGLGDRVAIGGSDITGVVKAVDVRIDSVLTIEGQTIEGQTKAWRIVDTGSNLKVLQKQTKSNHFNFGFNVVQYLDEALSLDQSKATQNCRFLPGEIVELPAPPGSGSRFRSAMITKVSFSAEGMFLHLKHKDGTEDLINLIQKDKNDGFRGPSVDAKMPIPRRISTSDFDNGTYLTSPSRSRNNFSTRSGNMNMISRHSYGLDSVPGLDGKSNSQAWILESSNRSRRQHKK
mmetsp:Transcript_11974/g.21849  ORF Transcript_11974/g.21849 Transcript_11974/m.21849 type:complete len:575 (-) Transcript_11974:163-1887(-)